jgi:cell division protein FtsA
MEKATMSGFLKAPKQAETVVGIDFGTTKICVVIAKPRPDGLEIVGVGKHPSHGIRKGVVVNIPATVDALKKAIEIAELMSGCSVRQAVCGIAGSHIKGFNSTGVVAIKNKEVTALDVERAIDAARAVAIPLDREVLHVIPQEFTVDDQEGVHDPIGMNGVRLESKVHIVTGAVSSAQNIIKCANLAGIQVSDIVLEPLAAAEACLTPDEKELGVALVDIGGGTTDIAVISLGGIVTSQSIRVGGNKMDEVIVKHIGHQHGLIIGDRTAEEIKIEIGSAYPSDTDKVKEVKGRDRLQGLPKTILVTEGEIREALSEPVSQIIAKVKSVLEHTPPELSSDIIERGITLTGGGSLLRGLDQLISLATGGIPTRVAGNTLECVALGTGKALEEFDTIRRSRNFRGNRG